MKERRGFTLQHLEIIQVRSSLHNFIGKEETVKSTVKTIFSYFGSWGDVTIEFPHDKHYVVWEVNDYGVLEGAGYIFKDTGAMWKSMKQNFQDQDPYLDDVTKNVMAQVRFKNNVNKLADLSGDIGVVFMNFAAAKAVKSTQKALQRGGGNIKTRFAEQKSKLEFSEKVSVQKMQRHVKGTAPDSKSYFNNISEAQDVLNAYRAGNYKLISENIPQGTVVIEVPTVTGRYVNIGNPRGLPDIDVPTNKFMIQSTINPKVVPVNPNK